MKRWILPKFSKETVNMLAEECNIDPFLALLAVVRGYDDPLELESFLSCDEPFCSPFMLTDMDKAVAAVNLAVEENKLIAIYGDYDCDGVTATSLLYTYLTSRGANVICYIPNRADEGYGMNVESVEKLDGMGVELIITVDNGINAVEEVLAAKERGIQVVITDHHIPAGELPDAVAVVDPHRADCECDFCDFSGVGVAFLLVCALENAEPEELFAEYSDLTAIGTVADVMPLVRENRVIVREGLMYINNTSRSGLAALIAAAGLSEKTVQSGNIAFNIAPRINAAGRMGDAMRAVKLLCAETAEEAIPLAEELCRQNTERQRIEAEIEKEAVAIIERDKLYYDRIIVVASENWHRGIVGIAASHLVERYGRPVIVLSSDGDTSVGSGRSIEGFSLFDAVNSVSDMLLKFGGHELAAGLTVKTEKIPLLREKINSFARMRPHCVQSVSLDCKLNPAALSVEMGELISALEPFGMGNRNPLFGIYSLKIERITPIGNGKHLRLILTRESSVIQALCFGKTQNTFPFDVGDTVDIAATLDINEYRGEKTLGVTVREIRPSGESDTDIETQMLYEDFKAGFLSDDSERIVPCRDEVGLVFRCLAKPLSKQKLINKLVGRLPVGKVNVACDVLCELGLCREKTENGITVLQRVEGVRSDLEKSEILKRLKEGTELNG